MGQLGIEPHNRLVTVTMPAYCWEVILDLIDHQIEADDYEDLELEDIRTRIIELAEV